MDNSAFTSIRNIVNKARAVGRIPEERDIYCVQHVVDGMRRLSLFNLPHKEIKKVSPDALGRVYMPDDCLKFMSLSIPINGRTYTFTEDKTLVQSSTKTYSYESFDTTYGEGVAPDHNVGGVYYGGGENKYSFFVNEKMRYVQIVGFTGAQCTMTYVSSGISDSPDGVSIPKIAEQCLISYVLWRDSEYDIQLPIQERQLREMKYQNEASDLDMILYAPTKDKIMDEYFKHLSQTIKR